MAIEFVNYHGKCGVDVSQDGTLIAWIRYTKLYGYIVDFEDDTSLEIEEMEKIINKMNELKSSLKINK